uniref:C2H2-type domain-containing protein n=1 Tax=Rhodosorus marinus TaxID=101924 RepID=A0A7S3EKM5_9RHOD|mmetsp:Transcript_43911/g.171607  ORF Transcript_43911/g.171607 Transcript_43911/m.171607 type:complete len:379 (+) Transcript_43911:77-1213(+)
MDACVDVGTILSDISTWEDMDQGLELGFFRSLEALGAAAFNGNKGNDGSEFLLGCPEEKEAWLRFEGNGLGSDINPDSCYQRVVDLKRDVPLSNGSADEFFKPMLLNVKRQPDMTINGDGWILHGETPMRNTGEPNSVETLRFIEFYDDFAPAVVFSKRRGSDLVLMKMRIADDHHASVHTGVMKAGSSAVDQVSEMQLRRERCPMIPGLAYEKCRSFHGEESEPAVWFTMLKMGGLTGTWVVQNELMSGSITWGQDSDRLTRVHSFEFIQRYLEISGIKPRVLESEFAPAPQGYSSASVSNVSDEFPSSGRDINGKQCPLCHKPFSVKSKVVRHINTVHKNIRLHKCHICDKRFKEKGHLQKHLRSHVRKQLVNGHI